MPRIAALLMRHPIWIVAISIAITVFFASKIVDLKTGEVLLRVDPSAERLLPPHDESQQFLERISKQFGNYPFLLVALATDDVFTPEHLATVARVTEIVEGIEGVYSVVSLATASNIRSTEGSIEIEPFLAVLPESQDAADLIRADLFRNPLYAGRLVSLDSRVTALVVYLSDMTDQQFIDGELDLRIAEEVSRAAPSMEVWISGPPHIKATTSRMIFESLGTVLVLSFLIMGLLGATAFRSLSGVVIPVATVIISSIWTFGVVAWLDLPLNLVTTIVPPLLVTVAATYSLHMVSEFTRPLHLDTERAHVGRDPAESALRRMSVPISLTGLTTAAGLLALTISPFPAVREFGLIAVMGVAFSVITALTFAPAMLRLFGARPRRLGSERGVLDRLLEALGRFDIRHRTAILVAGAALGLLAIVGMTKIELNDPIVSNFAADHPTRVQFEAINSSLQGSVPIYVVIESDARDAFVQAENLARIEQLQRWLEEQPEIGGTTSIVDYVKTLNRALNKGGDEHFAIPENPRLTKQLLLFAAGENLRSVTSANHQLTNIHIRSSPDTTLTMANLVRRIEEQLEALPSHLQARVTGNTVLLTRTMDESAQGQFRTLGIAFFFIYVILVALFTSFRVGLLALIPNILPVLLYFGTLGFAGVPLNMTTGLFACIVLGIAVDDTIHFLTRFNSEARGRVDEKLGAVHALREVGRPVTITTVGLCLGFLALTTSGLRNQVQFGALGAFTLALAWLVDVTFTPALCSKMRVVTLWDALTFDLGENPQESIPVLRGLSTAQARIAALMTSFRTFPAGAPVFRVGEPGKELFVVLEGELLVSLQGSRAEPIELARCKRGDVVGEVALYYGKRTADVDAVTDTRVLRLTRKNLQRLRRRYPRIAAQVSWNLSEILADRVASVTTRVS
jgi:predicted RND superfamily exporter protein